jgi:hypothetical protein
MTWVVMDSMFSHHGAAGPFNRYVVYLNFSLLLHPMLEVHGDYCKDGEYFQHAKMYPFKRKGHMRRQYHKGICASFIHDGEYISKCRMKGTIHVQIVLNEEHTHVDNHNET